MSKYLVLLFLVFLGCEGNNVEFPFIVYEKSYSLNYTITKMVYDFENCIYADKKGNWFKSEDCSFDIGDTLTTANVQKPWIFKANKVSTNQTSKFSGKKLLDHDVQDNTRPL